MPQTSTPPVQESKWRLNTNEPWRDNRDMWSAMLRVPKRPLKHFLTTLTHSWLTGTNTKSFLKISTWRVHVFTRWCRLCLWQLRAHTQKNSLSLNVTFSLEWFKRWVSRAGLRLLPLSSMCACRPMVQCIFAHDSRVLGAAFTGIVPPGQLLVKEAAEDVGALGHGSGSFVEEVPDSINASTRQIQNSPQRATVNLKPLVWKGGLLTWDKNQW